MSRRRARRATARRVELRRPPDAWLVRDWKGARESLVAHGQAARLPHRRRARYTQRGDADDHPAVLRITDVNPAAGRRLRGGRKADDGFLSRRWIFGAGFCAEARSATTAVPV